MHSTYHNAYDIMILYRAKESWPVLIVDNNYNPITVNNSERKEAEKFIFKQFLFNNYNKELENESLSYPRIRILIPVNLI